MPVSSSGRPLFPMSLHMVSLWIVIGLIISAICVSTLGAAFSVVGLSALFSGAILAVGAMAVSLEFSKFVLAAYLHQRWSDLNAIFKYYLASAIVVLSVITSMGIFGFLSDAYQSASSVYEAETIKVESLKTQKANAANEIIRLNKAIDEIPANRVSKRLALRAEIEPQIAALTRQSEQFDLQITAADLNILEVKKKVGPLIYISKIFNMEIDTVVKYLIMIFVFVFDPLAICLVIATSEALQNRKLWKAHLKAQAAAASAPPPPAPVSNDEVIQMRFSSDEPDRTAG